LEKEKYELFIFDINVNGESGIELLKQLREYNNSTPTIIITAYTDTNHLEEAFEAGAHDYIKKPFELTELKIRIENTKKIFNINTKEVIPIDRQMLFSPQEKKITSNEQTFALSNKANKILLYFINNPSKTISNDELIQNIWHYENIPSDATIRSHIRTLRDIIGKEKISTIRGEGYIYEPNN
jgi:two-component system OmpR family response regulator